MKRAVLPSIVFSLGLSAACGSDGSSMVGDGTDQRPPTDIALYGAWIDTEPYLTWECEEVISPAEEPSPHGDKRICWNDAVVGARGASGEWPAGATIVKLHYTGETIDAISLETRVADADGPWFFWRRASSGTITNGRDRMHAQTLCVGCHEDAPRDLVWESGE
jgi:hypothetical protein